jgi:hypothetical protein
MDDQRAIELARQAIVGKVQSDDDAPITVSRSRKPFWRTLVTVTFGTSLPAGTRGPDFAARVTLDGRSGEVKDIQAGS